MEKTYKCMPFDLETAKKIQSGEVQGRILTQDNEPVRIVCFDKKSTNKNETYQVVALVEINGHECLIICGENGLCWDCENDCNRSLHIELPEETPKQYPYDRVKDKITDADRQEAEKTFPDSYNMQSAFISGVAYQICKEIDCQETPKHEKISMNQNKVMLMRRPDKKLKECEKQDLVWCELSDGILEVKIIGIIENDSKSVKHIWLKHTATGRSYYVNPSKSCWTKNPFKFEPFDKVLVTQNGWSYWIPSLYRNTTPDGHYICIDNYEYDECIPYEGNEHLIGTTK